MYYRSTQGNKGPERAALPPLLLEDFKPQSTETDKFIFSAEPYKRLGEETPYILYLNIGLTWMTSFCGFFYGEKYTGFIG
jgi:hypothetical protein